MTKRNAISKQLLIGLVGLSMAVATGAYSAEPDSASTVPAQSPITEVPQSPAESLQSPAEAPQSPSTASPIVGEESANATLDQVVASSSSLTTLNAAIIAAGLEATLSGVGPYTVFAPSDEAFAALPAGTLEQLLLPENKAQLQQIISYHVVPGNISSASITPGQVNTVEGAPVTINVTAGEVTVEDARVVEADIKASNGVIHVIDQVLLPPDLQAQ